MAVGSSSGRGHRGSQDFYEWEQYGVDPSIAPGLARARGWRVGLPDGSQAWDKTGPADTDWTVVGAGGGGTANALIETGLTNSTAVQIPGLSVVRITGQQTIGVAQADTAANAAGVVGILTLDTDPGASSGVVIGGETTALLESGGTYAPGDQLWLSPTTAGQLTNIQPAANAIHVGIIKATLGGLGLIDLNIYPSQNAGWDSAAIRIFAVDGENGDDGNIGFATTVLNPTAAEYSAACAAAGLVAKRTFNGAAQVFPKEGAGRRAVILIASGDYTADLGFGRLMSYLSGYADGYPLVRGTITDETAGSVAFAGDVADSMMAGLVTGAGMFAAGYNPIASPTLGSIQCQQVGGGAPGFTSELGLPVGQRLRFAIDTATAILQGLCFQIIRVIGTDTLVLDANPLVVGSPSVDDVFFIEQYGVVLNENIIVQAETPPLFDVTDPNVGMQLAGLGNGPGGAMEFINIAALLVCCATDFCVVNGGSFRTPSFGFTERPLLPIGFRRPGRCGGGWRSGSSFDAEWTRLGLEGFVSLGQTTFTRPQALSLIYSTVAQNVNIYSFDGTVGVTTGAENSPDSVNLGRHLAGPVLDPDRVPRIVGDGTCAPLVIWDSRVEMGWLKITGAGGFPEIEIHDRSQLRISGPLSGDGTDTDVGLDLTNAVGSLVEISAAIAPTLSGSLGDIRLRMPFPGVAIISWAQAIATGIVDYAGNRVFAVAAPVAAVKCFTGALLGGAGAALSYCADDALALLVANAVIPTRYPTSLRLLTRLRVMTLAASTNILVNTVTLYQNGLATLMSVTIPAGTAAFTKFSDVAHPILFSDGDDIALVISNTGADVGAQTIIAATLEGPA